MSHGGAVGEGRVCRGVTLVEVLVGSGLLLLVLSVGFSVLVPVARLGADRSRRYEGVDLARTALARMADDLAHSSFGGVYLARRPDALVVAVARLEDLEAGGARVWDTRLVLYHWKKPVLVRKTWPPGPPTGSMTPEAPPDLSPERLFEMAEARNGTENRLADGIEDFEATLPAGRSSPLRLRLGLSGGVEESWTVRLR